MDEELLEFLAYVEHSTDAVANTAKSMLVKEIHKKVTYLKQDKSMEVQYMTLLERDKEKFEEGKEEGREEGIKEGVYKVARSLLDILDDNTIADKTGLSYDEVKRLREQL
ncbi:hypothetical protein [Holtiella tumoricola]|uniref:hypothetical protein n=1 Tax=Holtiella tumoricola TaxID=3018743 RepID=UPI002ED4D3F9